VRRLLVLLAIGLIHLVLIWNGDILTEYAVAGFLVLPFLFGPRWLLASAAVVLLGLYLMLPLWLPGWVFPSAAAMIQDIAGAHRIYGSGGLLDVLMFRIRELPLILPLHVYVFPRTVGLFLLGMLAWRAGIQRNVTTHNLLLVVVAAAGICFGAATTLLGANGLFAARAINTMAFQLGTILLALGYGAAVIAASSLPFGKILFGWAARSDAWPSPIILRNPSSSAGSSMATVLDCSDASAPPARWPSALPSTSRRSSSAHGGCAAIDTVRSNGCGAR
jgi:uncharacterized protein